MLFVVSIGVLVQYAGVLENYTIFTMRISSMYVTDWAGIEKATHSHSLQKNKHYGRDIPGFPQA